MSQPEPPPGTPGTPATPATPGTPAAPTDSAAPGVHDPTRRGAPGGTGRAEGWFPVLCAGAGAGFFVLAGWVVDAWLLEDTTETFGYAFGAFMLAWFVGLPVLAVVVVLAVAASLAPDGTARRVLVHAGGAMTALTALAVVGVAGVNAASGIDGGVAFALAAVPTVVVLVWPLVQSLRSRT
ncbi:hypothetical protein [Nocardioides solisilvae]|uniref:hypothetical protein n=1 Tax=Nocardioides solisilvae TaxID=1542435 RepID=UPI000D746235|nr:hypothetical protein [Nocardioides solisilvae]